MNISFDLYRIFYYVCEFKSITKTANYLYVSQPAITKQIKNLENSLGRTLIYKTPKGIELTDDGLELYEKLKSSVESLNTIESVYKEDKAIYSQVVRIVAGVTTIRKVLLDVIATFNKKYPSVKFELSTSTFIESMKLLKEGKVDLIFLSLKEIEEEDDTISVIKLYDVQDSFIASKDYKDKCPDFISYKDFNKYPIICKLGASVTRGEIERSCFKNNIVFKPTYELSNNWLIEEYVRLGLGIGLIVKTYVKEDLDSGNLIEIKTDIDIPKREVGVAIKKDSRKYRILKEIINNIKEKNRD